VFVAARKALREAQRRRIPKGTKDREGTVEAEEDEDD
jgi:hypothetical protein